MTLSYMISVELIYRFCEQCTQFKIDSAAIAIKTNTRTEISIIMIRFSYLLNLALFVSINSFTWPVPSILIRIIVLIS